jgi:CHAT domain-containing protein/Flp pilus assembly protein TadD
MAALEHPADLEAIVEDRPDTARNVVESLWRTGLEERSSGDGGNTAFDRAGRLARVIERSFEDPSLLEATFIYEGMNRHQAATWCEADRLLTQAKSNYGKGESEEARNEALEALDIYKALGDGWGELDALHLLGNICWVSGQIDRAEAIYSDLLDRAGLLRNRYREAAAINNLAMLEETRGSFREAASGYRQALALGQAHGLERITGFGFLYQGNLYHRLGLTERAVPALKRAEGLFNRLGETRLEAIASTNRGASLHRMGEHREALAAYRRALSLNEQERDRVGRVRTLIHVAELLNESGDSEQALSVLEELLVLTRASDDPLSRRYVWAALVIAGDIHLADGRLDAARQAFQEAEGIAQEVGWALEQVETGRRRAQLFLAEDALDRAVNELESAIEMVEALRASPEAEEERIRFLDAQASVYEDLAGIYLQKLNEPLKAFELLERSRSRAFLDSLQGDAFLSSDGAGAPRVVLPSSSEPEPVERVVSQLPADGALLHFTATSQWLAILAFDRRGLRSWSVLPMEASELDRMALAFAGQVRLAPDKNNESLGKPGEDLAQVLLKPVEEILADHNELVIVPDKSLFQIPWAALPWQGQYLVEKHELLVEPSAAVFSRLTDRDQRLPSTSALLVAGSVAGEETVLQPLPGAEAEAREVAEFFPGSCLLLGPQATEQRVRNEIPRHGIVHFSTHARVIPDLPLSSSLLLFGGTEAMEEARISPVNGSDGVLTGYEALTLDLHPGALVTLAACETVGGKQRRGEGVVGLARAFFEAGAGTVVASLWSVEDIATRELMVRFYRKLSEQNRKSWSTAGALAEAQSEMARGEAGPARSQPFYWAGFVLIGDGR